MKPYMTPVAICGLAVLFSTHGRAQEQAEQDPSQIGRQQWQAQIKAARE